MSRSSEPGLSCSTGFRTAGSFCFAPGAEVDSSILGRFESNGIERSRVVPVPREGLQAYFATYNTIDIALDPFPYNGGTTTLDALWMGVPVVTVAGGLPVGRAGVSMLTNLGLQNLIAKSRDEYVRIAVETAADLTGLAGTSIATAITDDGLESDGCVAVRQRSGSVVPAGVAKMGW